MRREPHRIFLPNGCAVSITRGSKYALVDFDFWYSRFELTRDEAGRKKFFDLFYTLIDKIPEWDKTARKRCYIELAITSGQFKIVKQHLDWFVAELQKLLTDEENLVLYESKWHFLDEEDKLIGKRKKWMGR